MPRIFLTASVRLRSQWPSEGDPSGRVAENRDPDTVDTDNRPRIFYRSAKILTRTSAKVAKAACADVAGCWLRNGLELDHLRSGKCDAQHLGPEVHEHCRIAVLGADHGTEAVPIMADSIAHGVRHYSDGWRLVEGTSWEGPRGAGAARSHASSVRPLGRAGAPLPEVQLTRGPGAPESLRVPTPNTHAARTRPGFQGRKELSAFVAYSRHLQRIGEEGSRKKARS